MSVIDPLYRNLVPDDSFIGLFLRYMKDYETAEIHDFWCALWCLGSSIGPRTFVVRPGGNIYFNWYVVLLSNNVADKNATGITAASRFLIDTQTECISSDTMPWVRGMESKDEVVSLAAQYKTPSISMATRLFRTTPTALLTTAEPSVLQPEFASCCIYAASTAPKSRIPWPKDKTDEEKERVRAAMEIISREVETEIVRRGIQLNTGAVASFSHWYYRRTTHADSFRSAFESREDEHLLRIAGCLAINDLTFEVQSRHIGAARKIINAVKSSGFNFLGGASREDDTARYQRGIDKLRTILIAAGMDGHKHSRLHILTKNILSKEELVTVMTLMHECGYVQKFKVGKPGKKSSILYRATKNIESLDVTSAVQAKMHQHRD